MATSHFRHILCTPFQHIMCRRSFRHSHVSFFCTQLCTFCTQSFLESIYSFSFLLLSNIPDILNVQKYQRCAPGFVQEVDLFCCMTVLWNEIIMICLRIGYNFNYRYDRGLNTPNVDSHTVSMTVLGMRLSLGNL